MATKGVEAAKKIAELIASYWKLEKNGIVPKGSTEQLIADLNKKLDEVKARRHRQTPKEIK